MVGAENCRGECGGGLLVDITAEGEPALAAVLALALAVATWRHLALRGPLTTVSDTRQARVVRLRESAESW